MSRSVLQARPVAQLLRRSTTITPQQIAPTPLHRRHLSSTLQRREEPKASFKGQLYESTQQRLKRERAEQERYSQYQTQSPGSRYAGLIFGTYAFGSLDFY